MNDLHTPAWLDEPFLIQTLEQDRWRKRKVKIIKWSCQPAVANDCNSLSELNRIYVDYETVNVDESHSEHSTSIIVKTPKDSELVKQIIEKENVHAREANIYRHYLPYTYDLHWSRPNPKSFPCNHDNFVVTEDLKAQGYKSANRLKQLDLAHCRESLKALARFHGTSVGICHRIPEIVQTSQDVDLVTRETYNIEQFSKYCITAMVDTIKQLDGCERYSDILKNTLEKRQDRNRHVSKSLNDMKVLLHGDFWTANILFNYNSDDEVVDAKLVDLKQCRFGSFAYDLIVFWWTSANEQVREHHRKELFTAYRRTFNETLYDIGIKERITEEHMENELKKYAPFTLEIISYVLVVAMTDPEDPVDYLRFTQNILRECANNEHLQTTFKNSKYYKTVLPTVLRQAEEFGAFT